MIGPHQLATLGHHRGVHVEEERLRGLKSASRHGSSPSPFFSTISANLLFANSSSSLVHCFAIFACKKIVHSLLLFQGDPIELHRKRHGYRPRPLRAQAQERGLRGRQALCLYYQSLVVNTFHQSMNLD